jgi:hypothetical protein
MRRHHGVRDREAETEPDMAVHPARRIAANERLQHRILLPVRNARTVAFGLGAGGVTALAPAARLTRRITENLDLGIEYGGALGSVGAISPPSQQAHIAYGVADIKLGAVDLDVGIGYGLTAASNGLALKLGIGH